MVAHQAAPDGGRQLLISPLLGDRDTPRSCQFSKMLARCGTRHACTGTRARRQLATARAVSATSAGTFTRFGRLPLTDSLTVLPEGNPTRGICSARAPSDRATAVQPIPQMASRRLIEPRRVWTEPIIQSNTAVDECPRWVCAVRRRRFPDPMQGVAAGGKLLPPRCQITPPVA